VPHALVTGATGLLGSYLVERLLADGWTVRALVRDPQRAAWLSARGVALHPRVVQGSREIRFDLELGYDARVAIDVLDVVGRRVASLLEGGTSLRAGRHHLVWDGRSVGEYPVPSGVYFARVTATPVSGGSTSDAATARWLLLR